MPCYVAFGNEGHVFKRVLEMSAHKTLREVILVSSRVGCSVLLTFCHYSPMFQLITWKQMKILQKAIGDHETKIGNTKDLCDTFLKVW